MSLFNRRLTHHFSRLVFGFVLLLSGCSLDMFQKHSRDSSISERQVYRKMRTECSGLQLERAELSAESFRSLLNCFNSNGSLPELNSLVTSASTASLQKSVSLLNEAFLADAETLKESRAIIQNLEKSGKWQSSVKGFQALLQDPERLHALIRLVTIAPEGGDRRALVASTFSSTLNRFEPRETMAAFELLGRLFRSRSFLSLQAKVLSDPLTPEDRKRLVVLLTNFFSTPTKFRSAHALVSDMTAGKSAPLWNFAFGGEKDVLRSVSTFHLLLKDFGANQGTLLREFSRFHRGFHRPVSCWGGGKIFRNPWTNLTSEFQNHTGPGRMTPFLLRFAPVTALAVRDFCEIPPEFDAHYQALAKFALGRSGGEYVRVLNEVFKAGMGESAGYFVGEWGESLADGLGILSDKPWFSDLLLLFSELDSADRDRISTWVSTLVEDEAHWGKLSRTWNVPEISSFFSDVGTVLSAPPGVLDSSFGSVVTLFESSRAHPWFAGWKKVALKSADVDSGFGKIMVSPDFSKASAALGGMAGDGRLADLIAAGFEWIAGGGRTSANIEKDSVSTLEVSPWKKLRHAFSGGDLSSGESPLELDASLQACARLDVRKLAKAQWQDYQTCLVGGGISAESISSLGKNAASIASFAKSWIDLPMSSAQRSLVVEEVIRIKDEGADLFKFGLGSDEHAIDRSDLTQTGNGERRDVENEIRDQKSPFHFEFLHRFASQASLTKADFNRFFNGVGKAIDDPRLPGVYQAFLRLTSPEAGMNGGGGKVKPVTLPDRASLTELVIRAECDDARSVRNPEKRANEIANEFSNGVVGFDYRDGTLPVGWKKAELWEKFQAFADVMKDYDVRSALLSWASHLNPGAVNSWFISRTRDPRAVVVMDEKSGALRVRWMTTLDRFESILVNSNFSYLLPGNYGLKFIGKFANSWGDEPREKWPSEIRDRYSNGRRPPTLRETYDEVFEFLRNFERVGGLPKTPECAASVLPRAGFSIPDLLLSQSLKAKAFNLKQTLSVVEENLPGSDSVNRSGMKFLRDLFWSVTSSHPHSFWEKVRGRPDPLRVFQVLGDLGALRTLNRAYAALESNEEFVAMEDVLGSVKSLARTPELGDLVEQALNDEAFTAAAFDAGFDRDFSLSRFAARVGSWIAADRTLGFGPGLIRFSHSLFSQEKLPKKTLSEAIHFIGSRNFGSRPTFFTRRDPRPDADTRQISRFFQERILGALDPTAVAKVLRSLESENGLRQQLFSVLRNSDLFRQNDAVPFETRRNSSEPALSLLLGSRTPHLRHAFALWCGQSAGGLFLDLVSRPDEADLMLSGVLGFKDSAYLKDVTEAFLRQLPD